VAATEAHRGRDARALPASAADASAPRRAAARAAWIALGGVLVLALLLRVLPLTYAHFWDETVFLQHARILLDGRTNYDEFDYRPPVLPFLYAAGFLAWNNLYAANVVQGLFTALGVAVGALHVRAAFGRTAAFCFAVLFAFMPYLVDASHDLLTDAPALTLMLAAMWAFDKDRPGFLLLSGVLYGLAVETRFTSLFLLVYFALQAVFVQRRPGRLAWWAVAAAATIAPYLIWIRLRYGDYLHPFILARRIVTEWTAPVPARFYVDALVEIFPVALWPLVAIGLAIPCARAFAARRAGERPIAGADAAVRTAARVAVLVAWAVAFFAYMLSIPHKEVRYLLPLAIPLTILGAQGLAEALAWLGLRKGTVRVAGVVAIFAIVGAGFGPSLGRLLGPWSDPTLAEPWVGRSTHEAVQIGRYLDRVAAPGDTIYAAHNFPVLAFYSGRRTVSLLPIQDTFVQEWRALMDRPGYFVAFLPEGIIETHSRNPLFLPDRAFIDAHPEFRVVQTFPDAIVYRYDPSP
jgi:4-amino-4-deoxy-L-arabinose transferase-like glycosyltransferase